MKAATLPPEFQSLAGKVQHVQQVSETEYCSSCPNCGDNGHQGRELPDRFRIFLDGGNPRAWCRKCGYFIWADQTDPAKPAPSHAELERWRAEQIEREQARKRSAERALELLQSSALWDRLHDELDGKARSYWTRRGVPEGWQNYWRLGWAHDRSFGGVTCDAAAIPLFGPSWQIQQIKYRLTDDSKGRYRYEVQGLEAPPFYCEPDGDYSGHVVAIEGEIKSMVTFARMGDGKTPIIGMPGTNPGKPTVDLLSKAERVTLVVDPGAKAEGVALAKQIGLGKCWLLVTPVKIDDGILAGDMGKRDIEQMLGSAQKLTNWMRSDNGKR